MRTRTANTPVAAPVDLARQSARLCAKLEEGEAVARYARRLREEGLVDAEGWPVEPATRSGR